MSYSIPALLVAIAAAASAQPVSSSSGLTLHNVVESPAALKGKQAVRLVAKPGVDAGADHLAIAEAGSMEFSNGTIEVDVAGEPAPGAAAGGARGFVGVAFRVQPDRKTYDCFYVRPTNGRADDQERRNHSVQYISHPQFTWSKLRQETPSRYESYADIQPGEWIHLKIEVNGDKARLYVNNSAQPVLIVNDVKSGADGKGSVAIWFEGSTIAHYANFRSSEPLDRDVDRKAFAHALRHGAVVLEKAEAALRFLSIGFGDGRVYLHIHTLYPEPPLLVAIDARGDARTHEAHLYPALACAQ